MDALTSCCLGRRFVPIQPPPTPNRPLTLPSRRPRPLPLRSSGDGAPEDLDQWDQMELKFGRLIGEDPKLTLAKIMARKSNPEVTPLDVEKSFSKKNEGGPVEGSIKLPPPRRLLDSSKSAGFFAQKALAEKNLLLSRPAMNSGTNNGGVDGNPASRPAQLDEKVEEGSLNVRLRKPTVFRGDDGETDKALDLRMKPNLFLKMRKGTIDDASDVTLLKRPEVVRVTVNDDKGNAASSDSIGSSSGGTGDAELPDGMERVEPLNANGSHTDDESHRKDVPMPDQYLAKPGGNLSMDSSLQGKPQRLNMSEREVPLYIVNKDNLNLEAQGASADIENFISAEQEELIDRDWKRAEDLLQKSERDEVELISCSTRGFVASFGSLIGFLPYRNLGAKWKFLSFESWLRKKGLDPSLYKQNLSIVGSNEAPNEILAKSTQILDIDQKEKNIASNVKVEYLLEEYDQEKAKFLSSFVGQKIRVNVTLADRNSRRLMFSGRRKVNEELVERKRRLMSRLSIGDVVKCCVTKITYFGIFVEVEGVPALIHQSEILEAKVHQLDFTLERITLSLKQITPDPLMEALETVAGDRGFLDGGLEAVQTNEEWADVESLIKELQQIEGIQGVSKGRFFVSPGLAPTFQVYMASMFNDQYKLLARSGNRVQEVMVRTSLDKEQMKAAILACTNRVE
ncbi:hypothetical protein QJS04_geneDACA000464 [Acorus gramineus]|uniref:S1 motif domain-containing protein n=1 Tax=Acorus gramineus TaxID=55184 RepID=A0AAV9ATZ9_ACOGR|nr:hypothetical protein QJS04_geneDACA000464 [Acorus gramineus]